MEKCFHRLIVLFISVICFQNIGFTQHLSIGDPFETYIRLLPSDENLDQFPSFNMRPIYKDPDLEKALNLKPHPWQDHPFFKPNKDQEPFNLEFLAPQIKSTFNSHLPVGQNDDALWQGKGLNTQFSTGFSASYGILHTSIRPQFVFSQNLDFKLSNFVPPPTISRYGVPNISSAFIDRPQRFGEESINRVYPGQSWIRMQYNGLAAGVSTENIWSGPATENPIVFSNNGPGFAHLYIGTYKPVKTVIGNFEGRLLGGRLYESDYFDSIPGNNKRFMNAIILNYSPSFVPGLHLGGSRMIQKYYPENGFPFSDFFEVFQPFLKENFISEEVPSGNVGTHQLLSLFARWVFPSYGMEVYTEWSRNDHSADTDDLLRHFEHARAYVLGFTKTIELSNSKWVSANIEVTQLEVPRLDEFRLTGSYYHNGEVDQGFTNDGQVLGAGIGPGSNNQRMLMNIYYPKGLWGFSVNRIAHHNDLLYQLFKRNLLERDPSDLHNIEFRLGLHSLRFLRTRNLEIQGDLYWSHFMNYDYQFKNDRNNFNLQLSLRYFFANMAR